MGDMFRKQGVVRMIVIVVALLLVVGLVGGVLAATKTSSGTISAKTVMSSSSSSNSGSSSGNSGSEGGGDLAPTYTLTYSLGSFAYGMVPAPQTLTDNGPTVSCTLSYSPAPSKMGAFYFVGWSITDGATIPTYSMSNGDNFVSMVKADVVLYPVFASGYAQAPTVTYCLGDYATGDVPSPTSVVTMMNNYFGANFDTYPTCTKEGNWKFIGWAREDNASIPEFTQLDSSAYNVTSNFDLYPVFREEETADGYVTVDASDSDQPVYILKNGIYYDYVPYDDSYSLGFVDGVSYTFITSSGDFSFSGTYQGQSYASTGLSSSSVADSWRYTILDLSDDSPWVFSTGDTGTIKCVCYK